MKKILFMILSFFMLIGITNAAVDDVQFVGGTGGSKILELNVKDNSVASSGIIYDRNASLVYEITYTNMSDLDKKVTDVILPDTDILLSYDLSELKKEKIIKPGETVKFKYSIKALENVTDEQLETLNESAHAELVMSTVEVITPETSDIIVLTFLIMFFSFSFYKFIKDKKVFYGSFVVVLGVILLNNYETVIADDVELVDIDTDVKYVFSNLAPSCANLDYEGDFCIDWKQYGSRDKVNYLVMTDSKDMSETYKIGDVDFVLQNTYDVSEQQNEDVILGVYKAQVEEESYLFLIGQNGGVIVPKDASYQFTSYDSVNNKNEYDFHYVKYLDFSKFYSNKTTDMEYMLVGIGTQVDMEKYDLSGFETSNVINMKGMFTGFGEGTDNLELDVSHFDTSNVTDMSWMFWEFGARSKIISLDLSNFDTSNVTTMNSMFYSFGLNADTVLLNIYDFDTSNVSDMKYMFYSFTIYGKSHIEIDFFKNWDTSKVTDMSCMFGGPFVSPGYYKREGEIIVDVTGLDTQNVVNMNGMFGFNERIKEIIGEETFVTSNVISFYGTFACVDVNELSVENWDVSNTKNIDLMFYAINYKRNNDLKSLDLSKWDVANIESASLTFAATELENLKVTGWNLSSLVDCSNFIAAIRVNVLDLSELNFVNSSKYNSMFYMDPVMDISPSVIDISGSDWNENATTDNMFKNLSGATIYVKDEKAKAFIEPLAVDCTVLVKE